MDKHKLDSHFKKAINKSNDFYNAEADLAKQRVWNQIKRKKKGIPLFYRVLAVASILLLIFLGLSTYTNLQYKSTIEKLVETNTKLKAAKHLKGTDNSGSAYVEQKIDTVYIERQNAILKPVGTTKYITDTVYIKETVYVADEKKSELRPSINIASNSGSEHKPTTGQSQNQQSKPKSNLADSNLLTDEIISNSSIEKELNENTPEKVAVVSKLNTNPANESYQKDILIKPEHDVQKKKKRTFKIKFGGSNSKLKKDALALSTTISK